MKKSAWFVLKLSVVTGLAVSCLSVLEVSGAETPPYVTVNENGPQLQLPETLVSYIKKTYPDLRIPSTRDLTGEWASFRTKKEVPYACWGNFQDGGQTDVALLLIGKKGWKLLSFHSNAQGAYHALPLEGFPGPRNFFEANMSPQQFHLYALSSGKKFKVGNLVRPVGETDSIAFFMLSDPESGVQFSWVSRPKSTDDQHRLYGSYRASSWGKMAD